MAKYKITFIGAGNVAWHLAPALENSGHQVSEVYSRHIEKAKKLSGRLYNSKPVNSLDFRHSNSSVFIIAVSDDAIEEVAGELAVPEGAVVIHTSGTKDLFILNSFAHSGIFYPLQTFTKDRKVNWEEIPILLEPKDETAKEAIKHLGDGLSRCVLFIAGEHRRKLHLAAVFACNFSNHLYAIANLILKENDLPAELLFPLVKETALKAFDVGAINAQTGPAIRKDAGVLQEHLKMLASDEYFKDVYKLLSKGILAFDKKSKSE